MSNPKLALIPSGYKGGTNPTVYSILPNDATGDFDFDRASEGTRVRKDGLIEEVTNDVPRLDWSDGNCPSLLLEPQRTNLQVRSEEFDNASWGKSNSSIENNSIISPNGELSADKLIANTVNTSHYVQGTVSGLSTSSEATFSVFVKKAEISQLQLLCAQNSSPFTNWGRLQFDLDTLSEFSSNIGTFGYEDYGNGWLRVFVTGTPTSTGALIRVTLYKNFSNAFIGNDIDGLYLFGAQVEQGNYPTSYIKTEASTVTRLKDECLNGGDSDLFDITEGTFFVDSYVYNSGNFTEITLSDGSVSNRIVLIFQNYGTQVRVFSSGGVDSFLNLTFDQRNKIAVTFKENEYKFYINGSLVGSDTSATVPSGMDRLNFSNNTNVSNHFEGKIYDTRVYDRVLTEAEAIELTT
jgi:hypothetical protein